MRMLLQQLVNWLAFRDSHRSREWPYTPSNLSKPVFVRLVSCSSRAKPRDLSEQEAAALLHKARPALCPLTAKQLLPDQSSQPGNGGQKKRSHLQGEELPQKRPPNRRSMFFGQPSERSQHEMTRQSGVPRLDPQRWPLFHWKHQFCWKRHLHSPA